MKCNRERNIAMDYLRIIAVLFVVVLHVNGYTLSLKSFNNYSCSATAIYYILEAIAIPSIHLFVLIGSYFMTAKANPIQSCLRIYSQTWVVTISGLFLACFIIPHDLNGGGVITSIFPFSQRAYWFVSDYIVLLLLSPFLNCIVKNTTNKLLVLLTFLLFIITCIFTFLSVNAWDRGSLLLFVLLYFISTLVKINESTIQRIGRKWLFGWGGMIGLLILSVVSIKLLSVHYSVFSGKELVFFSYFSPVVVFEAICLFNFFVYFKNNVNGLKLPMIGQWVCSSSLLVYLIHMHPIFKHLYTKYAILAFVETNSFYYFFYVVLIVGIVTFLSAIVGKFVLTPLSKMVEKVLGVVLTKSVLFIEGRLLKIGMK